MIILLNPMWLLHILKLLFSYQKKFKFILKNSFVEYFSIQEKHFSFLCEEKIFNQYSRSNKILYSQKSICLNIISNMSSGVSLITFPVTYGVIFIIIIIFLWGFFAPALADGFSLEFEWQQVFSSLF